MAKKVLFYSQLPQVPDFQCIIILKRGSSPENLGLEIIIDSDWLRTGKQV